jgi:hypothetical protein
MIGKRPPRPLKRPTIPRGRGARAAPSLVDVTPPPRSRPGPRSGRGTRKPR